MTALRLMQPSGSVNPTQEAFQRRTDQLELEREKERLQLQRQREAEQAEIDRRDADMLKVFQFAGDGYVNEAKYYAQQKGLQVPDDVFNDALLSKGLAMSGELYPDNPEAAQKYAMAFRSVDGDLLARNQAGLAAAGKPLSKTDRDLALYERKLQLANRYKSSDNAMTPYQSAMIDLRRQELEQKNQPDPFANVKVVNGVAYQVDDTGAWNPVTPQKPDNAMVNFVGGIVKESQAGLKPRPIDEVGQEGFSLYQKLQNMSRQPQQTVENTLPALAQNPDPFANNTIPSGLPADAKLIGTANGFPVYEDSAGDRYIVDGSP